MSADRQSSRRVFVCLLSISFLIVSLAGLAEGASAPQLRMHDPIPTLLNGPLVTTDVNVLASKGRAIGGVAADEVTDAVLRVPDNAVGAEFTFTVINDQ